MIVLQNVIIDISQEFKYGNIIRDVEGLVPSGPTPEFQVVQPLVK